jgi:acyl-coenzyme A synthetase/AMP-(fatty) acid ligase
MTALLPLITHTDLTAPLAFFKGQEISAAQYITDVIYCASQLPEQSHVLVACQDRYAFAVCFGAALVRKQVCMLPATHTEDLIASLQTQYPDLYCLVDGDTPIHLPQINVSRWLLQPSTAPISAAPAFAPDQLAAIVFTSGSTGLPVPNQKTWGRLTINVKREGQRLGVVPGSNRVIVGTVPPQHMYGFESTVLIALQNAAAFESSKPFYPADIVATVRRVPLDCVLVTTPFHLRALVSEPNTDLSLTMVVCATAPLAIELATQAESVLKAPLLEIYGSTETGQLATRRTTSGLQWSVFDGIQLHEDRNVFFASGEQVEGVVPINDVLTLHSPTQFTLHGRTQDMVNIAGKSTTLTHLNHQLLSIDGVLDGCFFIPNDASEGVGNTVRLAAVVVAPNVELSELQTQLRKRVATAFLPRPLKIVSSLPRNSTGKLPREVLLSLLEQ